MISTPPRFIAAENYYSHSVPCKRKNPEDSEYECSLQALPPEPIEKSTEEILFRICNQALALHDPSPLLTEASRLIQKTSPMAIGRLSLDLLMRTHSKSAGIFKSCQSLSGELPSSPFRIKSPLRFPPAFPIWYRFISDLFAVYGSNHTFKLESVDQLLFCLLQESTESVSTSFFTAVCKDRINPFPKQVQKELLIRVLSPAINPVFMDHFLLHVKRGLFQSKREEGKELVDLVKLAFEVTKDNANQFNLFEYFCRNCLNSDQFVGLYESLFDEDWENPEIVAFVHAPFCLTQGTTGWKSLKRYALNNFDFPERINRVSCWLTQGPIDETFSAELTEILIACLVHALERQCYNKALHYLNQINIFWDYLFTRRVSCTLPVEKVASVLDSLSGDVLLSEAPRILFDPEWHLQWTHVLLDQLKWANTLKPLSRAQSRLLIRLIKSLEPSHLSGVYQKLAGFREFQTWIKKDLKEQYAQFLSGDSCAGK